MSRSLLVDDRVPSGVSGQDPFWLRLIDIIRVINGAKPVFGRILDAEERKIERSGLVFVADVPRLIPHKLGRPAAGFLEVSLVDLVDGNLGLKPAVYPKNASPKDFISVVAASSGRTAIWVF